ncbi:MAG: peptidoglycan-binding domain-containing protein, partial [Woeseiaceae bacterium]|nr:peptidoglycan-binding domain-containing protein [Woeseiaceae bacterium]
KEPTATAVEAGVVEETLDAQLRLARDVTFSEAAFATLFGIWGETFDAGGGEPCGQAEQKGLSCHEQRGSWSSLRQLDRPAILTLTDTRGDTHEVVLTALHGEVAELSIAGVTVTHPVTEVSELWFGQFLVLWKPETAAALAPGIRNAAVVWLRRSLADIDERYRAEPLDSDVYDQVLAERVRDFQRDQRIDVDGFAGKQTQILINSLLAVGDRPRLTTPRLARD